MLTGKNIIITGANSGIGRVTALKLAGYGAKVFLACRSYDRTYSLISTISEKYGSDKVVWLPIDLNSLDSVKNCADSFLRLNVNLHCLINNAGVAGVITNTPGAIGYVNQSYIGDVIKPAAIQNKWGDFVLPSVDAGAKALNSISLDENLAGTNPNPEAEGAYPIATLTWILAYQTGNGKNTDAIKTTLSTILSDEYQDKAPNLGFIPLKGDILEKSRAAVERIGK